jgi:hypothetical protein
MPNTQITFNPDFNDDLLDMIEKRIHEIGKTYYANGQSFQDDLKLTWLNEMAKQMGFIFDYKSNGTGFDVTRHPYTPAP